MKKILPIIVGLSIVKLVIQFLGNRNYGFHRDELLHLSVSEHMDWGFMEFPPFIGLIGKIAHWFFDYSLLGVRFFPTLAGVIILVLCCLIAKELGGKSPAILLAGVCVLAFLPYYRNHTLFQPVAFDQLFWTWGFYLMVRLLKTENQKYMILLGICLGLGLMNKYTMLVWAFGIFFSLFFFQRAKLYTNKWLYISGGIAFFIFLPNIIWQAQHDFPLLGHLKALNQHQLEDLDPLDFGLTQLEFPFTLTISLFGLYALMVDKSWRKFRALGIAVIIIFSTMWIVNAKAYYIFAIYPVLFAAGAVKLEKLLGKRKVLVYVTAGIAILTSFYFVPQATPLLPIEKFVSYMDFQEEDDGRVILTSDYADMFGWEEQVRLVDSVYHSLSPDERNNCVLWAENYGEAGALKILGKKYGLPNPICRHGSFWSWGYGNKDAAVWISLGNEPAAVEEVFEDIELVKMIYHKYAIDEENGIPLYICRQPKVDIQQMWIDAEDHIFD